jgi:hypothetical protein
MKNINNSKIKVKKVLIFKKFFHGGENESQNVKFTSDREIK